MRPLSLYKSFPPRSERSFFCCEIVRAGIFFRRMTLFPPFFYAPPSLRAAQNASLFFSEIRVQKAVLFFSRPSQNLTNPLFLFEPRSPPSLNEGRSPSDHRTRDLRTSFPFGVQRFLQQIKGALPLRLIPGVHPQEMATFFFRKNFPSFPFLDRLPLFLSGLNEIRHRRKLRFLPSQRISSSLPRTCLLRRP